MNLYHPKPSTSNGTTGTMKNKSFFITMGSILTITFLTLSFFPENPTTHQATAQSIQPTRLEPPPSRPFQIVSPGAYSDEITHLVFDPFVQIRVEYIENWSVSVWGLSGSNDTPRLRVVNAFDCPSMHVVLFVGPPGDYVVLAKGPGNESFQQLVTIRPTNPQPNPPDPNPGPGPDPNPGPGPDPEPTPNVPNNYGLGHTVYRATLQVGDRDGTSTLGRSFLDAITKLKRQEITVAQADEIIRNTRKSLPNNSNWTSWEQAVEPALVSAISKWGNSVEAYIRFYDEISRALSEAHKAL